MGFFATFWGWLNGQLGTYIGSNTAALASVLEPAVVTLATLYVMAWGYLHLTGQIEEPFTAGLKRIITLAVILGVGLNLWLYNTVIVDTFYNAPAQLAAADRRRRRSRRHGRCHLGERRYGGGEPLGERPNI